DDKGTTLADSGALDSSGDERSTEQAEARINEYLTAQQPRNTPQVPEGTTQTPSETGKNKRTVESAESEDRDLKPNDRVHAVDRDAYDFGTLEQVTKYRYLLERTLERALKDHGQCLQVTGSLFSAVFPAWVTQTLVSKEAFKDLDRMVELLKETMMGFPAILSRLKMNGSEVTEWTVRVIGEEMVWTFYNRTDPNQ
ncbi:hypothetical protein V5799_013656, partial [Amblyomma americanum]